MTVEEAQAQHDMFFHLHTVAHNCGMANDGDWPRRRAAFEMRDYCTRRMRETFSEFAAEFEPPRKGEAA
jgi:hypothetical protein